ncbi:transmembrane protein 272-like [Physella acuta]|uniref:transmembrane protein 272-like n=1 Tax=Physella acuta TaxID=109671 RepID=UPI0027DDCD62|nr:transmembrane protein 272-like [Physella acuta]
MGVQYLEDCPDEHRIPIFLFAGGTVATLKTIHVLYFNYKVAKHASDILMSRRADDMIDLVLNVFLLVWHLMGSYWTLVQWWPPENEPLYDDPNEWCDPTCYTCAVIHVVVGCSLIVCKALIHLGLAFCYNCTGVFES